jgi:membrane protein implicated in regulation of membrane protease activity
MTFIAAVVLAIFVLPSPWGLIAIILSGIYELGQTVLTIRWTQRRRAQVGAEALAGKTARVVERCAPIGKVAVGGEIWNARCEEAAEVGETVRVQGLEGLTLLVERDQATVNEPASHQST